MAEGRHTPAPPAETAHPGDLGWDLGMVLRGYQKRFEAAVDGIPCGIRGFQVLSAVVHRDPPNQQALGAHLGIDRTVMTYLLNSLVDADAVERVPDPADARARKVVATARGRSLLQDHESRVAAAETDLLAGLDGAEAATLSELIRRLALTVHRDDPGSSPCEAMDHLP